MKNKEKYRSLYEQNVKDIAFYELETKQRSHTLSTLLSFQGKVLSEFTDNASELSDAAFESYTRHQTQLCQAFVLNILFIMDNLKQDEKLQIKIDIDSKSLFKRQFNVSFSENWPERDASKIKKILKQLSASNFFSNTNTPQAKLVLINKKTTKKYLFGLFSPQKISSLEPFFISLKLCEIKNTKKITDSVVSAAKKYKI